MISTKRGFSDRVAAGLLSGDFPNSSAATLHQVSTACDARKLAFCLGITEHARFFNHYGISRDCNLFCLSLRRLIHFFQAAFPRLSFPPFPAARCISSFRSFRVPFRNVVFHGPIITRSNLGRQYGLLHKLKTIILCKQNKKPAAAGFSFFICIYNSGRFHQYSGPAISKRDQNGTRSPGPAPASWPGPAGHVAGRLPRSGPASGGRHETRKRKRGPGPAGRRWTLDRSRSRPGQRSTETRRKLDADQRTAAGPIQTDFVGNRAGRGPRVLRTPDPESRGSGEPEKRLVSGGLFSGPSLRW